MKLNAEQESVVHYLRELPCDSLKRDAANIIEALAAAIHPDHAPAAVEPPVKVLRYIRYDDAALAAPLVAAVDNTKVKYALDRMCTPLDASRLSGVTAEEDTRCMKIIRDYVLADQVAPQLSGNTGELNSVQVAPQTTAKLLMDERIEALIQEYGFGAANLSMHRFSRALLVATSPASKADTGEVLTDKRIVEICKPVIGSFDARSLYAAVSPQGGEAKSGLSESLLARLSIHAADRHNTAFARSTMRELLDVLVAPVTRGEAKVVAYMIETPSIRYWNVEKELRRAKITQEDHVADGHTDCVITPLAPVAQALPVAAEFNIERTESPIAEWRIEHKPSRFIVHVSASTDPYEQMLSYFARAMQGEKA